MKLGLRLLSLIVLLVGFTYSHLSAQCSPTLKEIYNFEVGDQFYYRITIEGHDGPRSYYSYYYEDFTITDKYVSNDTIRYIRLSNKSDLDTILIIDSIEHDINKCDSSLARVNAYLQYYTDSVDVYAPIILETDSTNRQYKKFGHFWSHEFYKKDTTGKLVLFNGVHEYFSITFAEGVGLYKQKSFFFEGGQYYELQKFIRGNDTLSITLKNRAPDVRTGFKIYPNPVTNQCTIESQVSINRIVFSNLSGQLQSESILEKPKTSIELNTSSLLPGVYYLTIETENGIAFKKLLKY